MRSYLDCIPCFFEQAIRAGRMADLSDEKILELLHRIGENLRKIKLSDAPPKTGKFVYGLVNEISGNSDPYRKVKIEQNRTAVSLLPKLFDFVDSSSDRLNSALKVSAAGNIIDLGAQKQIVDLNGFLDKVLNIEHRLWNYAEFLDRIKSAKTLMILGDNAGEIVFDKVLLSVIKELYPKIEIIYAVRGFPTINDATNEDAISVGIDKFAKVLSNGSNAPGTLLDEVSKEFASNFEKSDIIISKGQGNYETLDDVNRDIFFVMTIKCEVVERHLGLPSGSSVLYYKH
ncbi:DUF89 family protein [bacterium]|nr:DUF89 family protein [bacterium]